MTMNKPFQYYKAIVGALASAAVVIYSAVQDSSAGGSRITTAEWVTAACALVIAGAGVWAAPKKPTA
jgi:hypothetical protein